MEALQPYQGESPSYFCSAWNGLNENVLYPARTYYDYLAAIPFAIKTISYFALARGNERVNHVLQSNTVTRVLSDFFIVFSINLAPTLSNMGYESKCSQYLPKQQEKLEQISRALLKIIESSGKKATSLAEKYETVYLNPNIANSNELISSAVQFLKKFFPNDEVLDQTHILNSRILAGYFKDLKEDIKYTKTNLELEIINNWINLFNLIN